MSMSFIRNLQKEKNIFEFLENMVNWGLGEFQSIKTITENILEFFKIWENMEITENRGDNLLS